MSFPDAALIEPLACVVKSLRRSGAAPGDRVYVIGLGVMGLLHVLAAAELGCEVFASDFIEERRAHRASATARSHFIPRSCAACSADGADVVICGPGTPRAMEHAFEAVAPAGTVVMFTPFPPDVPMQHRCGTLYFGDLRVVASYSCGSRRHARGARTDRAGVVSAEKVGATLVALDEVPRAYRELAQARIVKPIVSFGSAFGVERRHRFEAGSTTSSARDVTRHAMTSETA